MLFTIILSSDILSSCCRSHIDVTSFHRSSSFSIACVCILTNRSNLSSFVFCFFCYNIQNTRSVTHEIKHISEINLQKMLTHLLTFPVLCMEILRNSSDEVEAFLTRLRQGIGSGVWYRIKANIFEKENGWKNWGTKLV